MAVPSQWEGTLDTLDGYMTTDEMKDALRQVLVFPPDLVVEGDRILTSPAR